MHAGRVMTIDSDLPDLRDSDACCDVSGHENLACRQKRCRRDVLIDLLNHRCADREWYRNFANDVSALPTTLRWSFPFPNPTDA